MPSYRMGQAAELLGVSVDTVRRWADAGRLGARRTEGGQRVVDGAAAALQQGDKGAYVNFLGDEGPERVRRAYPGATWDRLVEVKRRYDPDNLFRRNHNIPPA